MTTAWSAGTRGQGLAVGLAIVAIILVSFATAAPAWSWFSNREAELDQRQALLRHMRDVAATLPRLREASVSHAEREGLEGNVVLPGATDALAAADLQERVQRMAASVGASLDTVETMPAVQAGSWRKVSLRISLNAPWPVLVDLFRSVETSLISIDDIDLHGVAIADRSTVPPIQASMVIYGFKSAQAGTGP